MTTDAAYLEELLETFEERVEEALHLCSVDELVDVEQFEELVNDLAKEAHQEEIPFEEFSELVKRVIPDEVWMKISLQPPASDDEKTLAS